MGERGGIFFPRAHREDRVESRAKKRAEIDAEAQRKRGKREIRLAIGMEWALEKRGFSKWRPSTITHSPFKCNSTLSGRTGPEVTLSARLLLHRLPESLA